MSYVLPSLVLSCPLAPISPLSLALLTAVLPYGPNIAEHVVMDAGLDPAAPVELVPAPQGEEDSPAADAAAAPAAVDADGVPVGVGLGGGGEEDDEAGAAAGVGGGGAEKAAGAPARSGVLPEGVRSALLGALGRLDEWFARMEAGEVPRGYITLTPPGGSGDGGGGLGVEWKRVLGGAV